MPSNVGTLYHTPYSISRAYISSEGAFKDNRMMRFISSLHLRLLPHEKHIYFLIAAKTVQIPGQSILCDKLHFSVEVGQQVRLYKVMTHGVNSVGVKRKNKLLTVCKQSKSFGAVTEITISEL